MSTPQNGNWLVDGKGERLPVLANAMEAMCSDRKISDAFAFDEMLCAPVLCHPVGRPIDPEFVVRPATDEDVTVLQEYLQRNWVKCVSKEVMHQAMMVRAHENSFHPVRDYLRGLEWDGVQRLRVWCRAPGR